MTEPIMCLNESHGRNFSVYHGDCCDVLAQFPSESLDFSIFSPPFSNLFLYSDSAADMGNSADDDEFLLHYSFLTHELFRITKPGRLCAVHCSDLPLQKWRDGVIGIKDLTGDIIDAHEAAGWILHSRITIWKNPVVEMQRTKALGLLHKQVLKDSGRSRAGMPDYLLVFRKDGENPQPIAHTREEFPVDQWQEWASPVWMTIDQTRVLNVSAARDPNDEKHLCPLQQDVIDRALILWSNPGDVVLSPFTGIGSEGFEALELGRKFVGVELKESYFKQAVKNLESKDRQSSLFESKEIA
jgi:DNA modification methylase